jgi:hypothetical protein
MILQVGIETHQDQTSSTSRIDETTQKGSFPDNGFMAHEIIQSLRSHSIGERCSGQKTSRDSLRVRSFKSFRLRFSLIRRRVWLDGA